MRVAKIVGLTQWPWKVALERTLKSPSQADIDSAQAMIDSLAEVTGCIVEDGSYDWDWKVEEGESVVRASYGFEAAEYRDEFARVVTASGMLTAVRTWHEMDGD
jgi:hypothetical protein